MKIGIITTLDTNIGDDFIRAGIINVLNASFINDQIEFILINKHKPDTIFPQWHPVNLFHFLKSIKGGGRLKAYIDKLTYKFGNSKFDNCDLIIQSGAPVIWEDCYLCEWNIPIWQKVVGRLHNKIAVVNLAAGSCYPINDVPDTIPNDKDFEYITSINRYSKITTCRDTLALKLFNSTGFQERHTLLPCTAFLFSPITQTSYKKQVLINYMEGGGHFSWGKRENKAKWFEIINMVYIELSHEYEICFLCHNDDEVELTKQFCTTPKIIYPKTPKEYIELTKDAFIAICNRMHASVGLASLGIPSLAVCTDTRLLMVEQLGLPIASVDEISIDTLKLKINNLIENRDTINKSLLELKKSTFDKYVNLLQTLS